MKLVMSIFIKGILFIAFAAYLANCSPSQMKEGPGDFGGGDVNLHGVTPQQVHEEVKKVNAIKTHLFRAIERLKLHLEFDQDALSDLFDKNKKESLGFSALTIEQFEHMVKYAKPAINKLYNVKPTIDTVLEKSDLETWLDKPCKTKKGADVDESYIGSDENKVCISGLRLSEKLNNLNLSKAVFSIAMHGLAHKAGADENEAKAIEYLSYSIPDTIYSDIKNSPLKDMALFSAEGVQSIIELTDSFSESSFYTKNQGDLDDPQLEDDFAKNINDINDFKINDLKSWEERVVELNNELKKEKENPDSEVVNTIEAQIEHAKVNIEIIKNKLDTAEKTLNYVTSDLILTKREVKHICMRVSHISNLNEIFDDSKTGFSIGKEQGKLLYEVHTRKSNILRFFCLDYDYGATINEFLKNNPDSSMNQSLMGEPTVGKGDGSTWYSESADSIKYLKILYSLNLKEMKQSYEIARPGNYTDLIIALEKWKDALNRFADSVELKD